MLLERSIFTFSPPLAYVTRDQFNDLCKTIFFRTEDYPTSTAVIVHSSLESLFQEFKWTEKDPAMQQQYDEWARLCRINLEISIANLDLLLPATMKNAQALLLAVSISSDPQYLHHAAKSSLGTILHGNSSSFSKLAHPVNEICTIYALDTYQCLIAL